MNQPKDWFTRFTHGSRKFKNTLIGQIVVTVSAFVFSWKFGLMPEMGLGTIVTTWLGGAYLYGKDNVKEWKARQPVTQDTVIGEVESQFEEPTAA